MARWGCCAVLTVSGVLLVDASTDAQEDYSSSIIANPSLQIHSRKLCRLVASLIQIAGGAQRVPLQLSPNSMGISSVDGVASVSQKVFDLSFTLEGKQIHVLEYPANSICVAGWYTSNLPSTPAVNRSQSMFGFLRKVLIAFLSTHQQSVVKSVVAAADEKMQEQCENYSVDSLVGNESSLNHTKESSRTMPCFKAFLETWLLPALSNHNNATTTSAKLHSPRPPDSAIPIKKGRRPLAKRVKALESESVKSEAKIDLPAAGSGIAAARTL